jgi:hypothetical protein
VRRGFLLLDRRNALHDSVLWRKLDEAKKATFRQIALTTRLDLSPDAVCACVHNNDTSFNIMNHSAGARQRARRSARGVANSVGLRARNLRADNKRAGYFSPLP